MRRSPFWSHVLVGVVGLGIPGSSVLGQEDAPIVVASKPFAESYVLAEAFAQLLEARGYVVDRRMGLGATEVAFQALVRGDVDVYPEYTGTGLTALLDETPTGSSADVFNRVKTAFEARWGVHWLAPLGFENTYAIAMRTGTADSLGIGTLSDLASAAPSLVGGFSPDFIGRPDGLSGLAEAYGIGFRDTRALLQAVKYRALAEGEVDVIDGYSTDGAISRFDLAILTDDRSFFPPYDAAPLVGRSFYEDRSEAVLALTELAGRIDVDAMRRANERVETGGVAVEVVARSLLVDLGILEDAGEGDRLASDTPRPGLIAYMWGHRRDLAAQTARHLLLVLISLGAAIAVALPAGLALERIRSVAEGAIRITGILQTIPGIALLAFMIPLFGIGVAPAVVALFLYSLLPILRNTYTGIVEADPGAVASGRASGMTELQLLAQIRLPLAAPIIMAGIRTAAVINVGTATLAAFIGAGGLGDPIVAGLALSDPVMILSGAAPAAALALMVDLLLARAERAVAPAGIR